MKYPGDKNPASYEGYYPTNVQPLNWKTKQTVRYFVVHLKLGEVADPYAPVWIQLVGEKGESGQIQIKPGYGPKDKFENGRMYKVVARVNDIGRVGTVGGGEEGEKGGIPKVKYFKLEICIRMRIQNRHNLCDTAFQENCLLNL